LTTIITFELVHLEAAPPLQAAQSGEMAPMRTPRGDRAERIPGTLVWQRRARHFQ